MFVSGRLIILVMLTALAAHPVPLWAAKFNRKLDVGQSAPVWNGLAGVDGRKHGLHDYSKAKVVVVAFTCNQCPVSQLYEDRLVHFAKEFKAKGVTLVAISCSLLPPDRLEKMKERAEKKHFNFDYLWDPTQQTGKDYGATVTPQVFVLDHDRKVAYMGKFDDNIEPEKVEREFVNDAVQALLSGKQRPISGR